MTNATPISEPDLLTVFNRISVLMMAKKFHPRAPLNTILSADELVALLHNLESK